jgi:hypothetical protein
MRRRNGELTIRERALAARNLRAPNQARNERLAAEQARNARLAAQSAARERQVLRANVGTIPLRASTQYSDDMKDNEFGPKRPKFIDPSDIRLPDVSSAIQWQDPNNRVPQTAMEYHNDIVRRRNANISRVLEDIRNVSVAQGLGPTVGAVGGRLGRVVNNLNNQIERRMAQVVYRFGGEDEKQN